MLGKRQRKKAVMFMLILCMVLAAVPSFVFAAPESGETAPEPEIVSEGNEGAAEEAGDAEEAGVKEETGENDEQTEPEDQKESEEQEKLRVQTEAPVESRKGADAAKSISVGDKIKYTGKRVGKVDQTTIFSYKEPGSGLAFTGTCRQAGIPMDKSGTGTIESRISNNSKIAKVLYRYAVQKGWLTGKNAGTNARKVLGLNYKIGFTYRRLIESACQIYSMGRKDFKKAMMNVGGVSEPTVDAIINWYSGLDVSKVKVPDGFELYQVSTAKGVQPFTMWAVRNPPPSTENGFVAVKKVSGDPSLTYDGEPDEIEDDTEE